MKRICLSLVAGLAVVTVPMTAVARCELEDLRGRWDVYGIANTFNSLVQEDEDGFEDGIVTEVELFDNGTTFDCVFLVNRRGRLADSVCVERDQGGGSQRIAIRGEVDVRRNCTIVWEFRTPAQDCLLQGTVSRTKDIVSGVANCDGGTVSLFNMVKT